MRLTASIVVLFFLSSGLILYLQTPGKFVLDEMVPQDVLGLLVIDHPPISLDSLGKGILSSLGLDIQTLQRQLTSELTAKLGALFLEDLNNLWLIIHGFEHRESGAWKLQFTALLTPHPFRAEFVKLQIEAAVKNIFHSPTRVLDQGDIRVYRGSQTGQVLYQAILPEVLVISNNEGSWKKTLRAAAGKEPSLAKDSSFRRVKNHLPIDAGVFIYVNIQKIFPLLPNFAYTLTHRRGEWKEKYYEVPD